MSRLHLPIVGDAGQPTAAGNQSPAEAFAALWLAHPLQQRQGARRDERLERAAQAQANFLAYRQLVLNDPLPSMHIGADGSQSNDRIRREGYRLPDWYPAQTNYCESVCVTHLGPQAALDILVGSSGHHDHVVGAGWFFGQQTVYGVGFAAPAWYVLVTAPMEVGK